MEKVTPDAVWDPQSDAGLMIRSVLVGRVLRINYIYVVSGHELITLEYEVTPPVDPLMSLGADDDVQMAWASRNTWWLTGRDDLGTEYEDVGGGMDPEPKGDKTEGERDLHPAPPPGAKWLDITFHGGGDADRPDHPQYTLRVNLPLPVLTPQAAKNRHTASG